MCGEISDEIKMRFEARVRQHAPGVTADRKHFAALDEMMAVELEAVGLLRHAPFVDHGLTVILASTLQPVELKQPIGRREKLCMPEPA